MDTCRGRSLIVLSGPSCVVPAQLSFIHGKAEKEEAQQLDVQLPVPRKSQGLSCWHSDLPFPGCLAPSCLPTALFWSCLSSLQGRLGGLGQLVLLTLGEVAWALVSAYLQGSLLITDTTTHGETPGPHSGP